MKNTRARVEEISRLSEEDKLDAIRGLLFESLSAIMILNPVNRILRVESLFEAIDYLDKYEFQRATSTPLKFRRVKIDGGSIKLVFERLSTGAEFEISINKFCSNISSMKANWVLAYSNHTRKIIPRIKLNFR